MSRIHKERILDYLWSISPNRATNNQIQDATGIKSRQQVYMFTQRFLDIGWIQGQKQGGEWKFSIGESIYNRFTSPGFIRSYKTPSANEIDGILQSFRDQARSAMSSHFQVPLTMQDIPGISKMFDLVSSDQNIVGDAIYYFTAVQVRRLPAAKFSVITERVWLLEKINALTKFLIFGNQRDVPVLWLQRYGGLVSGVAFYFLTDDGELELL